MEKHSFHKYIWAVYIFFFGGGGGGGGFGQKTAASFTCGICYYQRTVENQVNFTSAYKNELTA